MYNHISSLILLLILSLSANVSAQNYQLHDKFARPVSSITLVDWEGYIANPAIELKINPESSASFPLEISLTADGSRLYFNEPSEVGASGPSKIITLNDQNPISIYISVFPDEDGTDEEYTLTLNDGNQPWEIPVYVIDQDQPERPLDFHITLDFSEDQTNVTDDPAFREQLIRAANQWAYFIADMNLDSVPAGEEMSFIWNDDFNGGNFVQNKEDYKGFLLYAHGFNESAELRWGGGGSNTGFQTSNGVEIPLRRSGTVSMNVSGNRNNLGYNLDITDDEWYIAENLSHQPNDPFSIALHETGHALGFHSNDVNPAFTAFKDQGALTSDAVEAYQGSSLSIDEFDHFSTSIDQISKKGAFGFEFANEMPFGRWLSITKVTLLALEALGYQLRETTPFSILQMEKTELSSGIIDESYADSLTVMGGIPIYYWQIEEGQLPPGLELDSYTGKITGTPSETGMFDFTIAVSDYDQQTVALPVTMNIQSSPLQSPATLVAEVKSDAEIELTWILEEENATFILIERSLDSLTGYEPIDTLSSAESTYLDQNLEASTQYFYRIRAGNEETLSEYTDITSAVTMAVTGLRDVSPTHFLPIYPNPSRNHIILSSDVHNFQNAEIQFFDPAGRNIWSDHFHSAQEELKLDISSLYPGLYFIKIITDQSIFYSRLLKK